MAELAAQGVLVLFGPSVPEELREISIVTAGAPLTGPVAPGDVVSIGEVDLDVVAVGHDVDRHLDELDHVTVRFVANTLVANTDGPAPGLPGQITVTGPDPGNLPLEAGMPVRIGAVA